MGLKIMRSPLARKKEKEREGKKEKERAALIEGFTRLRLHGLYGLDGRSLAPEKGGGKERKEKIEKHSSPAPSRGAASQSSSRFEKEKKTRGGKKKKGEKVERGAGPYSVTAFGDR